MAVDKLIFGTKYKELSENLLSSTLLIISFSMYDLSTQQKIMCNKKSSLVLPHSTLQRNKASY